MASWNLHLVASKPLENVDQLAQDVGKVVTDAGYNVDSLVVTTDEGTNDVTPPAPTEEPTPPSADAPVASGETAS